MSYGGSHSRQRGVLNVLVEQMARLQELALTLAVRQ